MADDHVEVRKALNRIHKGVGSFQQRVGDNVLWYEYDEAASSTDQTYTEGPVPGLEFPDTYGEATSVQPQNTQENKGGNLYKSPVVIPAVWVRYISPWNTQTTEGSYLTSHITFRVSALQMRKLGLGNPLDPNSHMNDRFLYKSKLYQVTTYEPRGWLIGQYIMVDVGGTQLKPADMYTDPFPFWEGPTPPWGPVEQLNWPNVPPSDLLS